MNERQMHIGDAGKKEFEGRPWGLMDWELGFGALHTIKFFHSVIHNSLMKNRPEINVPGSLVGSIGLLICPVCNMMNWVSFLQEALLWQGVLNEILKRPVLSRRPFRCVPWTIGGQSGGSRSLVYLPIHGPLTRGKQSKRESVEQRTKELNHL